MFLIIILHVSSPLLPLSCFPRSPQPSPTTRGPLACGSLSLSARGGGGATLPSRSTRGRSGRYGVGAGGLAQARLGRLGRLARKRPLRGEGGGLGFPRLARLAHRQTTFYEFVGSQRVSSRLLLNVWFRTHLRIVRLARLAAAFFLSAQRARLLSSGRLLPCAARHGRRRFGLAHRRSQRRPNSDGRCRAGCACG